ncbi:MAG: F0F1 ATP synthase subunit gamma [Alphaproteobacteria bacterium]|nr:F0F1 ATP synthase subunit gamma [Alphaproteobacteria bacterium]
MPSLKDQRKRITSVKSTRKIMQAMKMVAASKLRRAQEAAEAARPYAVRMERMIATLAGAVADKTSGPRLLAGNGKDAVHLIVVASADRGLCGGFNTTIVRGARRHIRGLLEAGKTVKIICVGRKARDMLRREFAAKVVASYDFAGIKRISFGYVGPVADKIIAMFDAGEIDVCDIFYNRFKSVIAQILTRQRLIPAEVPEVKDATAAKTFFDFEPGEPEILADLLPRNLSIQIYRALLENAASEQGARMTAMDNATRNAAEMVDKLTIRMNRARQAIITKELIEIISGAEAI